MERSEYDRSPERSPRMTMVRPSMAHPPVRTSEMRRLSLVQKNVEYTPFHAHASLSRVKSDDPWGLKGPKIHEATIEESEDDPNTQDEATSGSETGGPVRTSVSSIRTAQSQNLRSLSKQQLQGSRMLSRMTLSPPVGPPSPVPTPPPKPKRTGCANCPRINMDWLFFIRPMGIFMVLEIGMCAIARMWKVMINYCFASFHLVFFKTWFFFWNLVLAVATAVLFLLHLCRFARGDRTVKLAFLLAEFIYNVLASVSLLPSAIGFLRISVDPNTNKSYSLSVVVIAGVCGIIASLMFGISAFFTFTYRRNYKDLANSSRRRRTSTLNIETGHPVVDDDEEIEQYKAGKSTAPPAVYAKRIIREK